VKGPPLSPEGSARALVAGETGAFPRELRAPAREHDLGDEALYLAWELARQAGLGAGDARALTRLVLASMVSLRQGSTRLPIRGPDRTAWLDPLWAALGGGEDELTALVERLPSLTAICGSREDYRPLVIEGDWLYHERLRASEGRLVDALRARLGVGADSAHDATAVDRALADVLRRPAVQRGREVQLSDEQQAAVRTALGARLTVISGGPGTGKTSIVASLLRTLARLGVGLPQIALAAPTGKAAHRMRQSIERQLASVRDPAAEDAALTCPEARTLHRLLGFVPQGAREGRFRHHENNRLAERVVIVDEASMIDLYLMDRLVRSMRDDARLVLLGDADQLPSVDAGAVFRDLVPGAPTAVRLTQSYRMDPSDPAGRNILSVARRIHAGRALALFEAAQAPEEPPEIVTVRAEATGLAFERVEMIGADQRAPFYQRWFAERVCAVEGFDARIARTWDWQRDRFPEEQERELAVLFDHYDRHRLLCATRGESPTGAAHVNAVMHRKLLERWREMDPALGAEAPPLLPGEPVLMQHNDYDRGLFNGDQGIVLRVSEDGATHPMVVFPRPRTDPSAALRASGVGFAVFHLDSIRPAIALAYAMTIHKSQGSELDQVGVVLPDEDLPLLTRELLYTAVTRSRRSVVLVGRREVLEGGVARQIRRFSGVAGQLGFTVDSEPVAAPPATGGRGAAPARPRRSKVSKDQLKLPF
jgi:exodeoxyribonuclease V alpha subunit